jgi:cytoskeletal protein CcmA (bactofilin family)
MGDSMSDTLCTVGEGIQIRGNLSGSGDLVVRGRVEGQISLDNHLTIEESGFVMANVTVQSITVNGTIQGDVEATDTVAISAGASMRGDIRAQEVEIADGASFQGRLEMDVPLPHDL